LENWIVFVYCQRNMLGEKNILKVYKISCNNNINNKSEAQFKMKFPFMAKQIMTEKCTNTVFVFSLCMQWAHWTNCAVLQSNKLFFYTIPFQLKVVFVWLTKSSKLIKILLYSKSLENKILKIIQTNVM